MSTEPLGVAIVGCGHIATGYARDLRRYPRLVLRGVTDLDPAVTRAGHGSRVPDLPGL